MESLNLERSLSFPDYQKILYFLRLLRKNPSETPEFTPTVPPHPHMKSLVATLAAALVLLAVPRLQAQTLNWGSKVFSDLADSEGNTLAENAFVFELGAFVEDFVPDEENVGQWFANWRVFDTAGYNGYSGEGDLIWGHFGSTTQIRNNVTNGSSSFSFAGLSAYIWIRNSDTPVEGSEWLLTRATHWVFPTTGGGCCENNPPLEWSVSDLKPGDVPLWGNQGGTSGPGVYTVTGSHTLQTYTFVPEPSSLALAALASCVMLRRRRIS